MPIIVDTEIFARLDLIDQDVTTFAAMIDAELLAHVPEWMPGESLDGHFIEVASDSHDSEAENMHSPLPNKLDNPLVLEWLSSGWKYRCSLLDKLVREKLYYILDYVHHMAVYHTNHIHTFLCIPFIKCSSR